MWIFNHYATYQYKNGAGRHYWFAENLKKMGYDVTIFCANTHHNSNEFVEIRNGKFETDLLNDIPFVFVKTTSAIGNGLDRIKNMFLFYKNLFSVAKSYIKLKNKPDLILASSVHPLTMVAGIQLARKLNIPCICEVRDLWPEAIFSYGKLKESSFLGKALIKGEHWIYKNSDAMIFTKEGDTDYIKERKWDIEQHGEIDLNKCFYINNGLDLKAFEESIDLNQLEDEDLSSNSFNVVYVGAIRPVNNVGKLLDTAKLLKSRSDIKFLIYGNGNELESIRHRVENEGLDNVKVKGHVDRKYIPYILSKSSVNILNYSQKQYNWSRGNSSNKLFEYMASGKPIVSTVKMGYSPLQQYNCGIELENGSPEELKGAILTIKDLSSKEYNELGLNAKNGSRNFDFQVHTNKLNNVIKGLIGE
ncbi:glycosyl transferase [Pontibacillus halophilus JSM 076056 = DSM 19796]|uniref:Glycosyl transferase n=1 Tax=Pontibacillus halophilus JSM 076056 = DSM 19796 TaxID=1385510 RepID=A0A0A5GD78_9BACI|nr:glycosyl transferase [Pontibacillus halophilus JSM 076056 = DSM 19796]